MKNEETNSTTETTQTYNNLTNANLIEEVSALEKMQIAKHDISILSQFIELFHFGFIIDKTTGIIVFPTIDQDLLSQANNKSR